LQHEIKRCVNAASDVRRGIATGTSCLQTEQVVSDACKAVGR